MNRKGFTLVELLVVMTFIGIIALIIFPNITGMLKKMDDNKYNAFLNDVFLATEVYVQKHSDKYPELSNIDGTAYVYFDDLIRAHLLKSTVINPKNNKKISELNYTIVVTKQEDKGYKYELVEEILNKETNLEME